MNLLVHFYKNKICLTMKNLHKLFTLTLIFFAFTSFAQNTETRELSDFSKLEVEGATNISLTQGSSNSISIETKNVETSVITTEVKNGTLVVSMKKGRYKNMKTKIHLTFRNLEKVELSGAGNIASDNTLTTDNFSLVSRGAGNIKLNLNVKKLNIDAYGAGNVNLSGNATAQKINSKGAGNINAFDLKGLDVETTLAGVGNIHVYASESIKGSLNGVGNIRYKGNPSNVNVSQNGIGNIRKTN